MLHREGREAVRESIAAAEPFQPTEEELAKTQKKGRRLSVGSDVEIARRISSDLASEHGEVVFCEGAFWHFATAHWAPFSDAEMRRAVHAYDGSPFGDRSVVRLGKGRIDSILHELAAIRPDDPPLSGRALLSVPVIQRIVLPIGRFVSIKAARYWRLVTVPTQCNSLMSGTWESG